MPVDPVEGLHRAREAYERREWMAAYEALSARDPAGLSADDFVRLGLSALLVGRDNDCIQALQRAFQLSRDAGATLPAARCACWLGYVLANIGEPAIGDGWAARARRLLDGVERDVVERGYLLMYELYRSVHSGRHDEARRQAADLVGYGERYDDADLLSLGLAVRGRLTIFAGRVPDGVRLLDEAMLSVTTAEVSPYRAGEVYCLTIDGCQEIADVTRAAEWTSALQRWCADQPQLVVYTGQCAVHRGQIMRFRGAFAAALLEYEEAARRYLRTGAPQAAGLAHSERGDVLRIQGDLASAEAAYQEASGHGHEPQPGLALLWVDLGRVDAALATVRRLLAEPRLPVHRPRILPAAVEVLLAADIAAEAAPLLAELERHAEDFDSAVLRAEAGYLTGRLAVVEGRGGEALAKVRTARRTYERLGAAYEVSRCRELLGRIFLSLGDAASARLELDAALAGFTAAGAVPAAARVAALLRPELPAGLTAREAEVLGLVAAGDSNAEIARALVLSEKTVARHLSNIFTKIDVGSRTAAAAFAHRHGLS